MACGKPAANSVCNLTNQRPGKAALVEAIDDLVEQYEKHETEAAKIREQKAAIEAKLRERVERAAAIKAYLVKHMSRLGVGSLEGAKHKATLGESQPVFSFDGPVDELPGVVSKRVLQLDKAACRSLYDAGQLPDVVSVAKTVYVRFQAVG